MIAYRIWRTADAVSGNVAIGKGTVAVTDRLGTVAAVAHHAAGIASDEYPAHSVETYRWDDSIRWWRFVTKHPLTEFFEKGLA